MVEKWLEKVRWLGHDSFVYEGPPVVYFDPWRLEQSAAPASALPTADVVLVSHEHGDHCSPEDVQRVSGPGTVIVANQASAALLEGDVRVMRPGDEMALGKVTIQAVPAYNVNKFRSPGNPFHPQPALHNGYVVTVEGVSVYFAGDTDHIPEMAGIECDVALLPVSGTYVMTAEEAAEAAKVIQPRVAVPMHYGAGVAGTQEDAARFRSLYGGAVRILKEGGT
jgi:L-ascorbate metabolism protein UlaG (beta-lactamase superfamily)